jgi:hypothetical protein
VRGLDLKVSNEPRDVIGVIDNKYHMDVSRLSNDVADFDRTEGLSSGKTALDDNPAERIAQQ